MLSVNSVLIPTEGNGEPFFKFNQLVVYFHPSANQICLLELHPNTLRKPKPHSLDEIHIAISEGQLRVGTLQTPVEHRLEEREISESRRQNRDKRFQRIEPVLDDLQAYFYPRYGKCPVAQRSRELNVSPTTLHRIMLMWLVGGQTKNALLGDYSKVGTAPPAEGAKKVGAKRRNSPYQGRPLNQQDKKNIIVSLKKSVFKQKGGESSNLIDGYRLMEKDFYSDISTNRHGEVIAHTWSPDNKPSFHQYYYEARKYFEATGKYPMQFKVTQRAYARDFQGRKGTKHITLRPGDLYEIDETPFDVALLSYRFAPGVHRVGRATLYVVYDVATNLVVGIYITLRNPSWETMRQALLNAFLPKPEFCARFGIYIDESDWPASGVCNSILGDNAELITTMSEVLEQQFHCTVRLAREAHGDDKGLVEGGFGVFKNDLEGKVPGLVFGDEKDRGLTPSRYRASLTIVELYQIVIKLVIHRNAHTELSYDKLDRDMARDRVAPRPLDLWNWGCKKRGGPKWFSEERIRSNLMSLGQASIRKNGVYFKGCWYNCDWTLSTGRQDRVRSGNKSEKIRCLYDANIADKITLVHKGMHYPATIQLRSRRFNDFTFDEVEEQFNAEKYDLNSREPEKSSGEATFSAQVEQIVSKAAKNRPTASKASIRNQNIRENRALEAAAETAELARDTQAVSSDESCDPAPSQPATGVSQRDRPTPSKSDSDINRALNELLDDDD